MLKSSDGTTGWMLPFRKWVHAFTLPLLLDMVITSLIPSQPLVLPKFDQNLDKTNCINNIEFRFPNFSFGRSMELMAVLKNREFFILNVCKLDILLFFITIMIIFTVKIDFLFIVIIYCIYPIGCNGFWAFFMVLSFRLYVYKIFWLLLIFYYIKIFKIYYK